MGDAIKCDHCDSEADATAVMGGECTAHVCIACLRWASKAMSRDMARRPVTGREHLPRFCENCARMSALSITFGPPAVRVCVDCVRTTYATLADALAEGEHGGGT